MFLGILEFGGLGFFEFGGFGSFQKMEQMKNNSYVLAQH